MSVGKKKNGGCFVFQKKQNVHNACVEVPEVPVACHTLIFKLSAILKKYLFSTIELCSQIRFLNLSFARYNYPYSIKVR